MTITREEKREIITTYKEHDKDSGSSRVQIAILTKRISELTEHFKIHKKDFHSRIGLLKLVSKRRKLLDYIKSRSVQEYKELVKQLGIRK